MNKARFTAPSAIIIGDPNIGEGTWIGHFTVLDGSNGLKIGKNCSIASGVHIYTHSTHELVTEGKPKLVGSVELGDNVAIGANSVILHGCRIGTNVVIPALTLLKPWTEVNKVENPYKIPVRIKEIEIKCSDCGDTIRVPYIGEEWQGKRNANFALEEHLRKKHVQTR